MAEQYGSSSGVVRTFNALLDRDISRLEDILVATGLPLEALAPCLRILIGSGYVAFAEFSLRDSSRVTTYYAPLARSIEMRVFLPLFSSYVGEQYGASAARIILVIAAAGRMTQAKVVAHTTMQLLQASDDGQNVTERMKTQQSVRLALAELAAARILVRGENLDAAAQSELSSSVETLQKAMKEARSTTEQSKQDQSAAEPVVPKTMPQNNLLDRIQVSSNTLEEISGIEPSAGSARPYTEDVAGEDTQWMINYCRFIEIFRERYCRLLISELYSDEMSQAIGTLMELGLPTLPSLNQTIGDTDSRFVSVASIARRLEEQQQGTQVQISRLHQLLTLVANDRVHGFLEQKSIAGAGAAEIQFRVVIPAIMGTLLSQTVAGVASGRFGPLARRVLFLLNGQGIGFLDQGSVAELTMLSHTDARAILFGLLHDGFIRLQELPRTAVANVMSSRCFQLFGPTEDRGYNAALSTACFTVTRTRERWIAESNKLAEMELNTAPMEEITPCQQKVYRIGESLISILEPLLILSLQSP